MISSIVLVMTIGSVFVQIPDPVPTPDPSLTIPAGPLPWAMPQFPVIDIDIGLPTPSWNEVEHTDDYDTNVTELESRLDIGVTVEADIDTEADDWIGVDANLPDMSTDDFETGIDLPGYDDMSASDIATAFGTNVGTLFAQLRSLTTLNIDMGGILAVIAILLLCIAWMALTQMIVFGVQFVDMMWSVITTIIEMIPVVE